MFDIASRGLRTTAARRLSLHFPGAKAILGRALLARLGERRTLSPTSAAALSVAFRPSANGGDYRRLDPGTITGPDWIRAMLSDVHAAEPVAVPPAGVAVLEDVVVCGEGVICKEMPDGPMIVAETLHNALDPISLRQISRDVDGTLYIRRPVWTYERLKGPHVCLRQIWDANYGHWLVECLPRLALVADHFDLAELKILVSRNSPEMRRITGDTLACFGIRPEQIVEARNDRPVAVDQLIYPLPMTIHPWIKAPRAIEILEDIGARLSDGCPSPRRLYVSRAGARQRHLRNEADVLRVLAPFDFTIVHPERLSFAEQVRLFSNAEVIVGNCGAALTNLVFAPRGVIVFALSTQMMVDDFFWDLTNHKGGRYYSLHGPAAKAQPDHNSDFHVDTMIFQQQLTDLLS